jgi:hypothetical protein
MIDKRRHVKIAYFKHLQSGLELDSLHQAVSLFELNGNMVYGFK